MPELPESAKEECTYCGTRDRVKKIVKPPYVCPVCYVDENTGTRKFIVGTVAVLLLTWGPLDHSWPAWLAIRTGYLILAPLITWFLLKWIWKRWKPDAAAEDRLNRAIAGVIAGILLVGAYTSWNAKTHIGNTQWIQTRDGMEAVGDDVVLPGPDRGGALMLLGAAGVAFWLSFWDWKPVPR